MQLSPRERDTLRELLTIGIGQAAAMLSKMVKFEVRLDIPDVRLAIADQDLPEVTGSGRAMVELPFRGELAGSAALMFPTESALRLVEVFDTSAGPSGEFDGLRASVLTEVGNIVLNHVMGSLGNAFGEAVEYLPPRFLDEVDDLRPIMAGEEADDTMVLVADAHFEIEARQIEGDILLVCNMKAMNGIVAAVQRLFAAVEPSP